MLRLDRGFVIDCRTRDIKMEIDYGSEAQIRGEALCGTTRRDLTDMLHREASRVTVEGNGSIKFVEGQTLVDYDYETPSVQLSEGSWQTADLVITCDGVGSQATKHIPDNGSSYDLTATGFSGFRFVLTTELFQQNGVK